jgi:hypothetical protein
MCKVPSLPLDTQVSIYKSKTLMILINPNPGKELEGGAVLEILIPGSLL